VGLFSVAPGVMEMRYYFWQIVGNFTGFFWELFWGFEKHFKKNQAHLWTPKKPPLIHHQPKKCHQSKNRFQHVSEIIN
jgi:hypothetical protein